MKKRLICMALVLLMVLTLGACGNKNKAVVYNYDYDLSEYITLGEYKGIEYEPQTLVVKEGDTVKIDYVGWYEGETFAGGTGSYDLPIGSGYFIDGFEEGLIGYTVGDEVTLDLVFPDPYPNAPDKAGQPVTFDVKINAINGYVESSELDEQIVWDKYFNDCEVISYPKKEYNASFNQQVDYYKEYATTYGMTYKSFMEEMGTTVEEFEADCKEYAESMIAQDMALYALARTEGIEPDEAGLAAAKEQMLITYGVEDEAAFEETYGLKFSDPAVQNSIEMTALLRATLDFLMENAVAI